MLEEVIHAVTVREMRRHLAVNDPKTGGYRLRDGAPRYMEFLLEAYRRAREAVPYSEGDTGTYYSQSLEEFIAGVFVSPEYRARLEARESGFIDRSLKMVRDLFRHLYQALTGGVPNYKTEMFKGVSELLRTCLRSFICHVKIHARALKNTLSICNSKRMLGY